MSFNDIASLFLQVALFLTVVRYLQDAILAEAERVPSPKEKWKKAALAVALLAAASGLALLVTTAISFALVSLALSAPRLYLVIVFLLGKGLLFAAAIFAFRLVFKVDTGRALKAAGIATLTAVVGDVLIRIMLFFFGAALIAQPLMMGAVLAGIAAFGGLVAWLRAHQARKMAAHAEMASEYDGLPVEQQIAAAAPEALIEQPEGPLSTTLTCEACGQGAPLDAMHCPACGEELVAKVSQPLSWRWVAGSAAASAVIAVLLALLLGPAAGAYRACSFQQPGAISAPCRDALKKARWGSSGLAMLPASRVTPRAGRAIFVNGVRYALLFALPFLIGALVVTWRTKYQPVKSSLISFAIAWPAASLLAVAVLGFRWSREGLVYALWLHLMAGAAWFVIAIVGAQLGRRLGKRNDLEAYL